METGEYWQSERKKEIEKRKKKMLEQEEKMRVKREEKDKVYKPPKEKNISQREEKKEDVMQTVSNIKQRTNKRKRNDGEKIEDYVIKTKKQKTIKESHINTTR